MGQQWDVRFFSPSPTPFLQPVPFRSLAEMATQCLVADQVPVGLECFDLRFAHSSVPFGKLFVQVVERADQARCTFLELSAIEEQYPTGHWHLPNDLTHGCNAVV